MDILNNENIRKISSLKYLFLAGEALFPELVEKFKRLHTSVRLENIYGPTEAAVYTSKFSLQDWDNTGCIPIGQPLANVELFVLGRHQDLLPIGVPGELCIAGAGLARGYLN